MEPDLEQYVRLKCQGLSFLGTTSDGRAIVFGNIVPPTWTMGDTFQGNGQLHITVQPLHNYKFVGVVDDNLVALAGDGVDGKRVDYAAGSLGNVLGILEQLLIQS
uniref:Uncharacterized protein n=1 Tax=Oryza glumipatula TaxID=40148 RepID=A0A0E0AQ51_9ORYZ